MFGWLGRRHGEEAALPLYRAVVARARAPHWYVEGGVSDTVDGRFDMVTAVLAVVLLRLETDPAAAQLSAWLTEQFVTDMDGQLREIGVGDVVVGKQIGKMIGMLGGRLGAYRDGFAAGDLAPALARNLYRGVTPTPGAAAHVAVSLAALAVNLKSTSVVALAEGALP